MSDEKRKPTYEELENELAIYKNSPYKEGYLGVLRQIETCNKDLNDNPAGLRDADDDKSFDKYNKYILSIETYYQKLEILRDKMSPIEKKQVDAKAAKSSTMAI